MLVCNVSQRPRHRAVAADLAEGAAADDASTTGFVVFATLVDDPASVNDVIDAHLGEIMLEAASAGDVVITGLVYLTAINEGLTAADVQDGAVPATYNLTVNDPTTASSTQDGTTSAAIMLANILSASRAGIGSAIVSNDGSSKTRIISNVGAVNG
jgi:hypothetical protein